MARDADAKLIRNVAFRQPRIHTSDHRAVVVSLLRGRRHGQLRQYRQCRQPPPLQPPPLVEEHIALMPTSCPNELCNHHAHLVSSSAGIRWSHLASPTRRTFFGNSYTAPTPTVNNSLALVSPKLLVLSSALPPVCSVFLPWPLLLTYIPSSLSKIHTP